MKMFCPISSSPCEKFVMRAVFSVPFLHTSSFFGTGQLDTLLPQALSIYQVYTYGVEYADSGREEGKRGRSAYEQVTLLKKMLTAARHGMVERSNFRATRLIEQSHHRGSRPETRMYYEDPWQTYFDSGRFSIGGCHSHSLFFTVKENPLPPQGLGRAPFFASLHSLHVRSSINAL